MPYAPLEIPQGSVVAIDIETCADPTATPPPEPELKVGNMSDPAKIEMRALENRRKQAERLALDPHYAKVAAVGVAWFTPDLIPPGHWSACLNGADASDGDLIATAIDAWSGARLLVTYHGCGFDIPFLQRRAALIVARNDPPVLSIAPTRWPSTKPYDCRSLAPSGHTTPHLDLYQLLTADLSNPLNIPQTLDYFAAQFGVTHEHGEIDKTNIAELVGSEDGRESVRAQALADALQTLALWNILRNVYP